MRKLFLLAAMAVAAFAFSASSASAVIVENTEMNTVRGPNTIAIHGLAFSSIEITALECDNTWETNISSDGVIDVHDIQIDPATGSQGNCAGADDCGGTGWDGQIEEGHGTAPWEYSADLTFCIAGQGGPLDGVPVSVECELTDNEAHCGESPYEEESEVGTFFVPAVGENVHFFVEGEVTFDDPLGLMHEEA